MTNAEITMPNGVEIKVWFNDSTGEAYSQFGFPPCYRQGTFNVDLNKVDGVGTAINNAIAEYNKYCKMANVPQVGASAAVTISPKPKMFGGMPVDESDVVNTVQAPPMPQIRTPRIDSEEYILEHLQNEEKRLENELEPQENYLDELVTKVLKNKEKRSQSKAVAKKMSKTAMKKYLGKGGVLKEASDYGTDSFLKDEKKKNAKSKR